MTGIHRGTNGAVIGGYGPDGRPIGTKVSRQPSWRQGGAVAQPSTGTAPATGALLNQRQNLFKQMEAAGAAGVTPEMRAQARNLSVTDESFNAAVGRINTNSAFSPGASAVAGAPATAPTKPAGVRAPALGAVDPSTNKGINKLTGLPFGTRPGDPAYKPSWQQDVAKRGPGAAATPPMVAAPNPVQIVAKGGDGDNNGVPDMIQTPKSAMLKQAEAVQAAGRAVAALPRQPSWKNPPQVAARPKKPLVIAGNVQDPTKFGMR